MKLSNTAINTYLQCPRKYFLHYRENLRPIWTSSALAFGSAMDEALNSMLLYSNDYSRIFDEKFTNFNLNNNIEYLPTSKLISYYGSDFDIKLLNLKDISDFCEYASSLKYDISMGKVSEFYDKIKPDRATKYYPQNDELLLYNNLCWLSMRRKAHLLLEAYKTDILPKITQVVSIQKNIELPNKDGDILTGIIDYIAKFDDGIVRVMDNKTSSENYTESTLNNSQQLAIYCESEGNYNCGYTVLNKKIGKKGVKTQILLGKISEEIVDKVFDNIQNVLYDIKEEKFEAALDDKKCFQFGQKCPFFNYCRSDGDMKNLVKVEKKV